MGRGLAVAALAVVGLLCAAGMGFAAYVVSRGSVAVPVTKLQRTPPASLAPARIRSTSTPTVTLPARTTTADDHRGRGRGGGGHGGDDD
jgi:hypothetical protein